ncbi:MAG TPA: TIGR03435 family protein [Candidatus Sulfopaludibacter sp.]|nr:TIGR03435 family protein [Candidatus Sulfopaludibacter sp.]
MAFRSLSTLLPLVAGLLIAQSGEKHLTFEVASVKAFSPESTGGGRKGGGGPTGPGTADPGRIHYAAIRLKDLVMNAYNLQDFQLVGPEWLNSGDETTRFIVDATMPPTTTKEQFRLMLQSLLAERFKLVVHREDRSLPTYSLVVARNGPLMKEAAPVAPPVSGEPPPRGPRPGESLDSYGFPPGPPQHLGTWSWMLNGRCRLGGKQATMQDLVTELMTGHLREPVTDDTGLKGKYDFLLTYSRPRFDNIAPDIPEWVSNPPEMAVPDLPHAIQEQLGLKLESKKGPVQVIVIDHIEKRPTAN